MKQPYDTDAHCGFFDEQSQQTLLSGRDCSSRRIFNDSGDAWRHGKRSAGKVTSAVRRRSIETWPSVGRLSRHADTGLGTRDAGLEFEHLPVAHTQTYHASRDTERPVPSFLGNRVWMIEHRIDRRFRSYSPAIRHGAPGDRQRGCRLHRRVLGRSERRTIHSTRARWLRTKLPVQKILDGILRRLPCRPICGIMGRRRHLRIPAAGRRRMRGTWRGT